MLAGQEAVDWYQSRSKSLRRSRSAQTAEAFDLELLTRPLEFGEVFLDERVRQFRERLRGAHPRPTAGCSCNALEHTFDHMRSLKARL